MIAKLTSAFLVASLLACNRTGITSKVPSDRDVQDIIEAELHRADVHRILIGSVTVTTAPVNNFKKQEISQEEFKEVEAWQKAGLIQVSTEDVLSSSKSFNWNDWLARSQNGALKRIMISPTERGVQLQKESDLVGPTDPHFVYARFYSAKVEEILENQEVKRGTDLFRITKGKIATKWSEIGTRVYRERGWSMTQDSKFILLLKYDPFKKQWGVAAGDVAPIDQDFKTDHVNQAIGV